MLAPHRFLLLFGCAACGGALGVSNDRTDGAVAEFELFDSSPATRNDTIMAPVGTVVGLRFVPRSVAGYWVTNVPLDYAVTPDGIVARVRAAVDADSARRPRFTAVAPGLARVTAQTGVTVRTRTGQPVAWHGVILVTP